jgi:hypothetical protein
MKLAIMQPYFMPYIGYFQLINTVDKFVIYDNIQYTKKGWINRNRILKNGTAYNITIPLKKDSDFLNVCERSIAEDFNREKFLNQITGAYRNASYFKDAFGIIEQSVNIDQYNLFNFIYNSLSIICDYTDIKTEMILSSKIEIDHSLKGKEKVMQICKARNADTYINAIGGMKLYDKNEFLQNGIKLYFLRANIAEYKQFQHEFVPNLSIIDVLMFNSKERVKEMLNDYELI